MAVHAGQRQAVISQNVANSDTPGFIARDIPTFRSIYQSDENASSQRATRSGHLHGLQNAMDAIENAATSSEAAPNGNTVSLETEMLKSVDAKRQHDRALAIYKSALGVLRTAIGK
jgi:flagellar basal-body rod protein FlgB